MRVRAVLAVLAALTVGIAIVLVLAVRAEAKTVRICNPFGDCWLEERGDAVRTRPKRHVKKKRKPEVRAYVKREDDDRVVCKDVVTVIGDARPSESQARDDAESVFMRSVRYRYGESWMDPRNARDYASRCARASITEIVGQTMVRCELRAKPCRAPFESK